jgi:hypothetical protein
MKYIDSLTTSIVLVVAIYFLYKISIKKKINQKPESVQKIDFENSLSREMESIIDAFRIRCISHNIFNIITKKNLSEEIWRQAFKDRVVEYGFPIINFPNNFFSSNGIKMLSNWLTNRGVKIKSEGAIVMLISEFIMEETGQQAEKIVEEAIAAVEKQKAG